MLISVNMCSIHRPLDDKTQLRIKVESEAVLAIIALCESGPGELVSSDALEYEAGRNPRIGRLTHKTCWATHSGSSSSRPRSRSEPAPIMRQGSSHSTRSTIHAPSRPGPTTSALVTTGSSSEPGPFIAAPRKVVNPLELIREIGS